jgi:hypothetical protein
MEPAENQDQSQSQDQSQKIKVKIKAKTSGGEDASKERGLNQSGDYDCKTRGLDHAVAKTPANRAAQTSLGNDDDCKGSKPGHAMAQTPERRKAGPAPRLPVNRAPTGTFG